MPNLKSWGAKHANLIFKIPGTANIQSIMCKKPQTVYIELTNACNLTCETCRRGMGNRKIGYISFDLFRKVVDDAASIGNVKLLLYFGGESLLHKDFTKLLTYAMSKRACFSEVGFFTNGMRLNKKTVDELLKLDVDAITVSLDGVGAVTEKLRRGSVYEVIEKNLNYLVEAKGNKPKPHLAINATISDQTDKQLSEIKDTWAKRFDEVRYSGMIGEPFKIVDLKRARQWNPNYLQQNICGEPFSILAVLWNGDVTFCCQDIYGRGVIDNISDKSLMQVWNGKTMKHIRQSLLTGNVENTVLCSKCEIFDFKNHKLNA